MKAHATAVMPARDRDGLVVAAGVAFVATGAWYGCWAISGADIEHELDISHGGYGALLAVAFTLMAAGHYAGGRIAERFGLPRSLAVLAVVQSIAVVVTGLAGGTAFAIALIGLSLFSGATNTVMNAAIVTGDPAFVVRFHAWFNCGALLGAAATAVVAETDHEFRVAWVTVGVVSALCALVASRDLVTTRVAIPGPRSSTQLRDLVSARPLVLIASLFLLETAVEASVDTWGVLSLRDELGASVLVGASAFVAGQVLAIVARAAIGPRLGTDSRRGSAAAATMAAAGRAVVGVTSSARLGAVGLALAVMGMAVCGPLLLARAARGIDQPASVVGAVQAAAMPGFIAGPLVAGLVADGAGVDAAMVVLSIGALILAASSLTASTP
jgi:fucose permease